MGAFEDYMNRPHPYHCGVGNCGPCEAKKRHDELASERAAGARDERAMIVSRLRGIADSHMKREVVPGLPLVVEADAQVMRVLAFVQLEVAKWIELGCP